jgi:hypothetical protein
LGAHASTYDRCIRSGVLDGEMVIHLSISKVRLGLGDELRALHGRVAVPFKVYEYDASLSARNTAHRQKFRRWSI